MSIRTKTPSASSAALSCSHELGSETPPADLTEGLERDLDRLGFLPTPECPVLWRGLGKSGFGIFLYLDRGIDLQTLRRLSICTDRAGLLIRAAALDPEP